MKKTILLSVGLVFLFSACAFIQQFRGQRIVWPEQIEYMEAMCDLDMSWRGMKYRGSMSFVMDYPYRLHMEIYGPFGDTVLLLKKDGDDFLLAARDEQFRDQSLFEDRFGIKLQEFMDDITMMSRKRAAKGNDFSVRRMDYKVIYKLKDNENTICWEGKDGVICIRFLEVKFEQVEDSLEESNNQDVH